MGKKLNSHLVTKHMEFNFHMRKILRNLYQISPYGIWMDELASV